MFASLYMRFCSFHTMCLRFAESVVAAAVAIAALAARSPRGAVALLSERGSGRRSLASERTRGVR